MNLYAETQEGVARLAKAALYGLVNGCREFESETGLPTGMGWDPTTGVAYVDFKVNMIDGSEGINAASEQMTQGQQVDSTRQVQGSQRIVSTEEQSAALDQTVATQGAQDSRSTTTTTSSTTTEQDGGEDRNDTRFYYRYSLGGDPTYVEPW